MTVKLVDIFDLASTKKSIEGELALFDFESLPELLSGEAKKADVHYKAYAVAGRRGLPAVMLELTSELTTRCVHCAQAFTFRIDKKVAFLLTRSETEADAIPLEEDGDFEVIVGSNRFDVIHWIEEELILSLPAFPRHPDCEVEEKAFSSEETEDTAQTNKPFSNLAELMKGHA